MKRYIRAVSRRSDLWNIYEITRDSFYVKRRKLWRNLRNYTKRYVRVLARRLGLLASPLPGSSMIEGPTVFSSRPEGSFFVNTLMIEGENPRAPLVACILDEFTRECLRYEADLMLINPGKDGIRAIKEQLPDIFFMESCWRGNGTWGTIEGSVAAFSQVKAIVALCKELCIPTVFWNKEDPVHFERFSMVAQLFDIVFTSDEDMVPVYYETYGINARPMSFAAQPAVHNPLKVADRLPGAVFAGSYCPEYAHRCADFDVLVHCLEEAGISYDIYDRHANGSARARANRTFPERFQNHIRGYLPPSEMWRVYKGYKYQINLNTVKDSPTMFARRVFESLASGTPVISNPSKAMTRLFGEVVVTVEESCNTKDRLREIDEDISRYNSLAIQGVKEVFRAHTYGHRLNEILLAAGVDVAFVQKSIRIAVLISSEAEIVKAQALVDEQTYLNAQVSYSFDNEMNASFDALVTIEDLSNAELFEEIAFGLR